MVGINLDGSGPSLAVVRGREASAGAGKLDRLAEALVGLVEGDGDIVPGWYEGHVSYSSFEAKTLISVACQTPHITRMAEFTYSRR